MKKFTTFASIIFLCANIIFFFSQVKKSKKNGEPEACSADNSLKSPNNILSYISSKNAAPSCKTCLTSVKKLIEKDKSKILGEATANMILIPAKEYLIGSQRDLGESDEYPLHKVQLDAFYLDKYEVNAAAYLKFVEASGAGYPEWIKPNGIFNIDTGNDNYYKRLSHILKSPQYPIIGITWKNANDYCQWANKRLPTEAEWEAAAKANTQTIYSFGDKNEPAEDYAWFKFNSNNMPGMIGQKKSNAFGLYDMHGNVWEWVNDFYDKKAYESPITVNPQGPDYGRDHIIRGGSWDSDINSCRSSNRARYSKTSNDIGFRCALSETKIRNEIKSKFY